MKIVKKVYDYIKTEHWIFILKIDWWLYKKIHINKFYNNNILESKQIEWIPFFHWDYSIYKIKNKNILIKIFYILRRMLLWRWIIISLIWPDWAWKTTISNNIQKMMNWNGIKSIRIYFWNICPSKFAIITFIINVFHKHRLIIKAFLLSKIWYLVVLDRFTFNNTIDYHDKNNKIKNTINKFFFKLFIIKPDYFILLNASPQTYFHRKWEYNINKLKRMLDHYKKEITSYTNMIIDVEKNNIKQVTDIIFKKTILKHIKKLYT
jgi:hypothetical protein